jgi:tRNA A37 N6-isopentenylltransferase MiaA
VSYEKFVGEVLQLGLTAPRDYLYQQIDKRVSDRIAAGAATEDPVLASDPQKWCYLEHSIARRQLTWFAKNPSINWLDITAPNWHSHAVALVTKWYNL